MIFFTDKTPFLDRCNVCHTKGTGVVMQCAYGQCLAAWHPPCALRTGVHVVPADSAAWQLAAYCPEHASGPEASVPIWQQSIWRQLGQSPSPLLQHCCAVCQGLVGGQNQSTALLCSQCGIAAHPACVGIEIENGGDWRCAGCSTAGSPPPTSLCTVCIEPLVVASLSGRGGMFLRGCEEEDSMWSHAHCVASIPELRVESIYCYCGRPFGAEGEGQGPMVECSACEGWFHNECVGLTIRDINALTKMEGKGDSPGGDDDDDWLCPTCEEAHFIDQGGTVEGWEEGSVLEGSSPIVRSRAWSNPEGLEAWLTGQKREWRRGGRWRPLRQVRETGSLSAHTALTQAAARLGAAGGGTGGGTELHRQGGRSVYHKGLLAPPEAGALWNELIREADWRQSFFLVGNEHWPEPRLTWYCGDLPYVYHGVWHEARPCSALMIQLLRLLEEASGPGHSFNSLMVTCYRGGDDHIGKPHTTHITQMQITTMVTDHYIQDQRSMNKNIIQNTVETICCILNTDYKRNYESLIHDRIKEIHQF